jgi:hypothetical protein
MTKHHDQRRRSARVAEPVQVYLNPADQALLNDLSALVGSNKSDVLRRGLAALERELSDPASHPALGIIGIAAHETAASAGYDVAREHDRYFADLEDARARGKGRRAR